MNMLSKKDGQEKKPLTAAQKRKRKQPRLLWLRRGIQLCFFLLAPSLFTGAFSGVKYLFTQIGRSQPFEMVSFVKTLIGLLLLTVLLGRWFCGWVCAFGSLGDWIQSLSQWIQKKCKKELPPMPDRAKNLLSYLPFCILTAIAILCAAGVYGSLSGWSPWDVFSMVTGLNLRLSGYELGLGLLILILLGMAWTPRFFCRFLCPMGAVFRLLPILPWSALRRNRDSCIRGCSACTKRCPMDLSIGQGQNAGDCIRCGKCTEVCPKGNMGSGLPWLDRHPEVSALLGAVIFLIAAWCLGCLRFV